MAVFRLYRFITLLIVWPLSTLPVVSAFAPATARALTIRGGADAPQQSSAPHTMLNLFKSAAVRAGMQSASIMTVADIMTQLVVEKKSLVGKKAEDEATSRYDPVRTLRWATVGLTLHGPYFRYCFARLDQMFAGTAQSLLVVAKKTALAQFIVFPPYLVALFTAIGLMEGSDDIVGKVRTNVPKAFMGGCIFWPVANCFNFALVPTTARVPYLASVGALWNGYLSFMNSKSSKK